MRHTPERKLFVGRRGGAARKTNNVENYGVL